MLFDYLTHVDQHGEAFAGYRVKGNPMVLLSLVDGTALASVHLRMVGNRGQALMARRPGDAAAFQGVLAAEGQPFELVLTNLTTDTVLMMDIGGVERHTEPGFWEKTDKTFWSGRHRNDRRLNRSNIVWPMTPNVCDENNIHYQDTGVSRRLQLLAQKASAAAAGTGEAGQPVVEEAGFPVFVYPKHGSRAAARFERTVWACPEAVVVLGSPQLTGDSIEEYNIQRDNPLNRMGPGGQPSGNVVDAHAEALGVSVARLLEVIEIDAAYIAQLPDEMAHEVLLRHLDQRNLRLLLEEAGPTEKKQHLQPAIQRSASSQSAVSPESSSSAAAGVVDSATPATVVPGERMLRFGGHNLLIEKFDFQRCSQAATLWFAVHEALQLGNDDVTEEELASLRADLHSKITELCSGRREALLEQICSVFETPECVICLSEKPDAVLYQCGHRCVHVACIEKSGVRRCPLCRAPIAAFLPETPAASGS